MEMQIGEDYFSFEHGICFFGGGPGTHLFFHVKLQECIFVAADLPLSLILNVVCQIAG